MNIVPVYVRKVMSAIITDHRTPDPIHFYFELHHEMNHLVFISLVKVPLAGALP